MNTSFRADLHCHSTCSDGSLTPSQLITLAVKNKLSGLSITDHDTILAYHNLEPIAKQQGIDLLVGVEFSASHRKSGVHILAYAFSPTHPVIVAFCEKHAQRRIDRCKQMLQRLAAIGKKIDEEAFWKAIQERGILAPGRPHIGIALLNAGYVKGVDEAFRLYLSEGKSCYVEGAAISVEETLNTIHKAGGLAIIAHPQLLTDPVLIGELLEMNFDGIEAYYARFSGEKEQHWVEVANRRNWIITGGSDFHGDLKPNIPLGCSWVGEETFRRLQAHQNKEVV